MTAPGDCDCGSGKSNGCGGSCSCTSSRSVANNPDENTGGCGCGTRLPEEDLKEFGPPPSLSGPEWDEWADRVLGETEYDTELGKRIARDAFRLARGELTKAEFHEKHHDSVLEEFDVDDRPTASAVSDTSTDRNDDDDGAEEETKPMPGVPETGGSGISRRTMLKGAGVTAAGIAVGTGAEGFMSATTPAAASQDDDGDTQLGMVIDMERCIACLLCVEGCKQENNTSEGANWMHVFRFSETDNDEMDGQMPRPCQHCSDAPCTYVCPTQARFKRREDGIVLTDYDLCIGCRYCEVGCPYGVNYFEWGEPTEEAGGFHQRRTDRNDRPVAGNPPEGMMGKCTFCVQRQEQEGLAGTTACEQACPVDAISFGDMNDPEDNPQQHLDEKEGSASFRLLDQHGTEPNIRYIGDEPSKDARPVDGPFSYEDIGVSETREDKRGLWR